MKKTRNIRIAAIACAAAGFVMFLSGWLMGADFALYFDNGGIRFAREHTASFGENLSFTSLFITSNIADIEITASHEPFSADFVTFYNNVEITYEIEGTSLFIDIEKPPSFLIPLSFAPINSVLRLNIPYSMNLDLIMINNTNDDTAITGISITDLFISSKNGCVRLTDMSGDTVYAELNYGNGTFDGVRFGYFEFGSTYGNGTFSGSEFDSITAGSQRGNLSFTDCRAANFHGSSRYGLITADNVTSTALFVFNTFGDIELEGDLTGWVEISNGSGRTTINLRRPESEYTYNLGTRGNVFVNGAVPLFSLIDRDTPNHLRVICSGGDIFINFSTNTF
jgi:hypothetical protein